MDADTTDTQDFIPYPINRVVGTVADAASAQEALDALLHAGFDRADIEVLRGEDGAQRIDPTGDAHGLLAQFQRTLLRVAAPAEEHTHLMRHADDLRAGRTVLMVLTKERSRRELAAEILDAHGATFIGFYGRWAWRGYTPAREGAGLEAEATPQDLGTASAPETFPSRFAEAWNRRNADAIAALFEDDADFVNVAGLWWHDRASIRAAYADAPPGVLADSKLTVDHISVKRLAADMAVIHARMTLSTEPFGESADAPDSRPTIHSFVVRRTEKGWQCAAAQATPVDIAAPTAPHQGSKV